MEDQCGPAGFEVEAVLLNQHLLLPIDGNQAEPDHHRVQQGALPRGDDIDASRGETTQAIAVFGMERIGGSWRQDRCKASGRDF